MVAQQAIPSDALQTQVAIKKLETEKAAIQLHDDKIKAVDEVGAKLVGQDHFAKDDVQSKLDKLKTDRADLGTALDAKKKALEEAYTLQKFNSDQAEVLAWLGDKKATIAAAETAADLAGVNKQLKKHQELKAAVETHDERVNTVKAQGDKLVGDGHSASEEIKAKVEAVVAERAAVAEALSARDKQLAEALELAKFNEEAADELAWLHKNTDAAKNAELPSDIAGVQQALKKHADAHTQANTHDQKVEETKKFGGKLVEQSHTATPAIEAKVAELTADQKALHDALNERKTLLEGVLDHLHFEESHREADTYVQDKHDEIKGFEVPKDLAAVHAALKQLADIAANVAGQSDKLNKVQDHGATLVSAGHPQTESIQGKVDGLKANRAALDQAHADHKKALEDALKLLKFDNDHQEASDFLADKKDVLDNLERPKDESTARSQLKQLADLRSEVDAHDDKIKQVKADGDALVAADHPAKDDVDAKLKKLAEERAAFAAALAQKEKQIRQAVELMDFSADAQAAENFLKDKETQLAHPVTTDSVASADAALKKHQKTLNELNIEAAKIKALEAEADKLIKDDHFDKDAIDARRNDIVARYAKLTEEAEKRQKVQT